MSVKNLGWKREPQRNRVRSSDGTDKDSSAHVNWNSAHEYKRLKIPTHSRKIKYASISQDWKIVSRNDFIKRTKRGLIIIIITIIIICITTANPYVPINVSVQSSKKQKKN